MTDKLPIWEADPEQREAAIEAAYELLNLLIVRKVDRKTMTEVEQALRESGLIE